MLRFYRTITAIFLGIFLLILIIPSIKGDAAPRSPRLANYYLKWELDDATVTALAQWDVVILDMEVQSRSRAQVQKLRRLNPDIILLAYIAAQEIRTDAAGGYSVMRRKLAVRIADQWYLTSSAGQRLSFWPGTHLLNITDRAPLANGERLNQALARFVADELLATGLWDGVFYDNAWEAVTWAAGADVDVDRDGASDTDADSAWRAGMRTLFTETRRLAGNRYLIVGNGVGKLYREELNGIMLETFPSHNGGWQGTMDIYRYYEQGGLTPKAMIINRNTLNKGRQSDYRSMRFGLTSALMGEGYYSFDHGDGDHGQTWWYDEYNAELGEPTGSPQSLGTESAFQEDVWRRDFENGLALVNPTSAAQKIDLGGEFEKLIGTQDKTVNDGSIVDAIKLPSADGIILLKTFRTFKNIVFKNGWFSRFYLPSGARARNGFFVFEEGYPGGAKIYAGDLDGDGSEERVVIAGPKMEIFNSRGELWFSDYPYGAQFKGEINVAIGTLSGRSVSIILAPSIGGKVIVYNYHGAVVQEAAYPLGKKYGGGFSVAIGNVDGGAGEVIFGTLKAGRSEVVVFDKDIKKIKKRFYPYGAGFRGALQVASGDFDGDRKDEIATAAMMNRRPVIRVFDGQGRRKSQFTLAGLFGSPAITLGAADVNFDGKDELVVMTNN